MGEVVKFKVLVLFTFLGVMVGCNKPVLKRNSAPAAEESGENQQPEPPVIVDEPQKSEDTGAACSQVSESCVCAEGPNLPGALLEATTCFPAFDGAAGALTDSVQAQMEGKSHREGCPLSLNELSLLDLPHWNPAGEIQRGQLIVATSVAEDVLFAFRAAYEGQFPIERMVLIDEYDGSDALSMKDNNTSAYNCRTVAGSKKWSQHSYGMAIDINPRWNPWVKSGRFDPKDGSAWKDREDVRPGMMVQGGVLIDAFSSRGWGWGGRWASLKDYMHVSANGL